MAKRRKIPQKTVGTKITMPMYDAMQQLLMVNAHVTPSDYLRDLIRRDLEAKGYRFHEEQPQKEAELALGGKQ